MGKDGVFYSKTCAFFGKDMSKLSTFCIANTFFRENACFIKYIHYLCNVFHSEARPQGFTIKIFATMTLNIYKDEYKASHLDYLRKAFTVESETSKVVTISGTQADLERAMMGMYNNDEQFKSLFPAFITEQERIENTKNEMKHLADEMHDTLLRIINYGVIGNDFMELRELYFAKFQKL